MIIIIIMMMMMMMMMLLLLLLLLLLLIIIIIIIIITSSSSSSSSSPPDSLNTAQNYILTKTKTFPKNQRVHNIIYEVHMKELSPEMHRVGGQRSPAVNRNINLFYQSIYLRCLPVCTPNVRQTSLSPSAYKK